MLTGVHFLLTYHCTFECDHCFVFGSPDAKGTFTFIQVCQVLEQARQIDSVNTVYFEGGEAMLYYPLLIESIRQARRLGLQVGIVTNAYFATSEQDAALWFAPLAQLGIADLSISDDAFHSDEQDSPGKRAVRAAQKLGLPAASICIEQPTVIADAATGGKGKPIVGGGVMFRGRAAEKLTAGLPTRPWESFTECRHEDLAEPSRLHVDAYGNVHLCQGISIGNLWETPLTKMMTEYRVEGHPIAGPLAEGGPALLAKEFQVPVQDGYVDACHLCYSVRKSLMERFPQYLAPRQMYGL
ncbi:MAG: radical SAM protein [Acidobacteriota bacterium]